MLVSIHALVGHPRRSPGPTLTGTTEFHRRRGRGDDHLSARGFEAIGWRDVADRSGVSVRTLMRHCSSGADLAWIGVERSTAHQAATFAVLAWGNDALLTVGCEGGTG